jgi:hypothetical protein
MRILAVFVNPERGLARRMSPVGQGFGAVITSCIIAAFMESFPEIKP